MVVFAKRVSYLWVFDGSLCEVDDRHVVDGVDVCVWDNVMLLEVRFLVWEPVYAEF